MDRHWGRVTFCVMVGLSVLSQGCATVAGGAKDQKVKITSDPPGAAVVVDGAQYGVTPVEVPLSRASEHTVELQHPGYEPVQVTLRRTLNPWLLGNVVIGGFLGLAVDVCTGATHNLTPDTLQLHLKPLGAPSPLPAAK